VFEHVAKVIKAALLCAKRCRNITGTCDCFEVKRLLRSGLKLAAPAFMIPAAKPEIQRRSAMVVDLSEGQAVVG
jgi:hypothetical protein